MGPMSDENELATSSSSEVNCEEEVVVVEEELPPSALPEVVDVEVSPPSWQQRQVGSSCWTTWVLRQCQQNSFMDRFGSSLA